ncbi:hypothetical protein GGR96_001005 [Thalassospira tepidiphila]|uniref:Uncharacterized protein n=1 Tax=Thalassospira tepidiphila TaxID=393657 RepID=A0ABX0WX85_9PROT|nr:hypothetical protein [Thalassospira tepidiphila]
MRMTFLTDDSFPALHMPEWLACSTFAKARALGRSLGHYC